MSTPELTTADKRNSRRESENESTESDLPELPVPPDGGWGWVVVFASFMIHIIADGVVYSFGIFYIEFLEYFKGGKGETSWIGSLVPGVTFATGRYSIIRFINGAAIYSLRKTSIPFNAKKP